MKPYTVLLLRPDYVADVFGQDTFMDHVMAEDAEGAQAVAQQTAWDTDNEGSDPDDHDRLGESQAYYVLAVFEGHIRDVKAY